MISYSIHSRSNKAISCYPSEYTVQLAKPVLDPLSLAPNSVIGLDPKSLHFPTLDRLLVSTVLLLLHRDRGTSLFRFFLLPSIFKCFALALRVVMLRGRRPPTNGRTAATTPPFSESSAASTSDEGPNQRLLVSSVPSAATWDAPFSNSCLLDAEAGIAGELWL